MAAIADVVVAGNGLIAGWLRAHGAREVRVIPTCFDARGPERTAAEPGVVELVWVGSPSTAARFRAELPRFRHVLESKSVQLTCVGAPTFEISAARPVRFVEWSPAAEHLALGRAHYGLSFLPRDEYSDHKCGFKLVQYLAYGVVPVATRSPVHEVVLGDVGHLIDPDTDVGSLAKLLQVRPTDREREAALAQWAANFSVRAGTLAWADLLSELTSD
jgi:glycosyltransferase involved in cell wall biosynthesis